jgi:hypothetical protein
MDMKISKREKIIILVAILVVLYGGYAFFTSNSFDSDKPAPVTEKTTSIDFDKIENNVKAVLEEKTDLYAVTRIGNEELWLKDPFYKGTTSVRKTDTFDFAYTGYLELENRRFAVINGLDYKVGEELEAGSYFVEKITPSSVVIRDKSGQIEIKVPLLED